MAFSFSSQKKQNASLQAFSGMATPARALWLIEAKTLEQLKLAIEFADQKDLPFMVLGEGSNTVFSQDYNGVVILNRLLGIEGIEETDDSVKLRVAAGQNWHDLVHYSLSQNWYGLQNLALIPGTTGAAPIQNIGAYGVEIADCLESVSYLDVASLTVNTLSAADCEFAYRDSVFKKRLSGKVIITELVLNLSKLPVVDISYAALEQYFTEKADAVANPPSPHEVYEAVCAIRSVKLPLPSQIPNCGSFFVNPIVSHAHYEKLRTEFPNLVSYPHHDGVKLAAAWLIEQAGWKQKSHNGVRVYEKQALVMTNPSQAAGKSVMEYADAIQQDIEARYGVRLQIEPNII